MSALVFVFSAGLFALAGLVVWPWGRAQRWLLVLMPLGLRLLLTGAIVALAGAAVVPDHLFVPHLPEEARPALCWLRDHLDFRLACAVSAFALVLAGLPCLVCLDFARALATHAAWLKRLKVRPTTTLAVQRSATSARPQPVEAQTAGKPRERRSLDELLG